MEYLSKWAPAVTCALDTFDSDMIAQVLLYDEVVLKYGLLERIISDNGSSYVSDAMTTTVLNRLGISRSSTSMEYPQTDELVERLNRTTLMKTSLAIVVVQEPNDWCEYLPFVAFAYNNNTTSIQSSTKLTPFRIMLHG